ncbi:Serine/arginine-rich splicing factor RS41 [Bienertia sinuspersici]
MRAIFCGNLEYDARQSKAEQLFKRYGRVDMVDMKSGTYCISSCYFKVHFNI